MKEETSLKDKLGMLEKEISTVSEKLEQIDKALKEIDDLRIEIKGIKLFIGRLYPEFKKDLPGILKKLK